MRSVFGLARASAIDTARASRSLLAVCVAAVALALFAPVFAAGPAPLTSDESLYLSEGYNMATGAGPRYPSHELINHRGPLFPALLSLPIRLSGGDAASAYLVPKLIVVALVAATFLLGRELFGTQAGLWPPHWRRATPFFAGWAPRSTWTARRRCCCCSSCSR